MFLTPRICNLIFDDKTTPLLDIVDMLSLKSTCVDFYEEITARIVFLGKDIIHDIFKLGGLLTKDKQALKTTCKYYHENLITKIGKPHRHIRFGLCAGCGKRIRSKPDFNRTLDSRSVKLVCMCHAHGRCTHNLMHYESYSGAFLKESFRGKHLETCARYKIWWKSNTLEERAKLKEQWTSHRRRQRY